MKKNFLWKKISLFIVLAVSLLLLKEQEVAAKYAGETVINGVKYILDADNQNTAGAYIEDIRGDNLSKELNIPREIMHQGEMYRVTRFSWGDLDEYAYCGEDKDVPDEIRGRYGVCWRKNVEIPDRARSYHACLRKITFAKGVKVRGSVYGYDQLRKIIFKDKRDQQTAYYNYCPKLKHLNIPKDFWKFYYNIQNCPSLKMSIAKGHRSLKMRGRDIYSKNGKLLQNAFPNGKKYKVQKGTTLIGDNALWGNETVEKVYLPDSVRAIAMIGLGNMPNLKFVRFGKKMKTFNFIALLYSGAIDRMDFPEATREIYYPEDERMIISPVRKVYVRAKKLKKGNLKAMPETTTFYVKNHRVEKQLRKFGFRGKIVIQPKMKKYDKIK